MVSSAMRQVVQLAELFERDYLLGATNAEKADAIDCYHAACREIGVGFELQDNFGAMISVLGGSL